MENDILDAHMLINKIYDGITISDLKGHFEIFNTRMQEMTGYSIFEIKNMNVLSKILYKDSDKNYEIFDRLFEITKKRGYSEIETTILTRDKIKKTVCVIVQNR